MCKLVEDFAKEYAKEYANEKTRELICNLVRKGALAAEIGAEQLNVSLEEFFELMERSECSASEPA